MRGSDVGKGLLPSNNGHEYFCSAWGLPARIIGERVGITAETVGKWRKRFEQFRVTWLTDASRSGRPRSIDDDKVAM